MATNHQIQNDTETQHRYKAPYTSHRPIPTIAHYNREKEERRSNAGRNDGYASPKASNSEQESQDAVNPYLWEHVHDGEISGGDGVEQETASWWNRITTGSSPSSRPRKEHEKSYDENHGKNQQGRETTEDTSEAVASDPNLKRRRKALGKRNGERAEREVTDPVTHLRVRIHDLQDSDLKKVPENEAPPTVDLSTATGFLAKRKTNDQLAKEALEIDQRHRELENLFPPPEYDAVKNKLAGIYSTGITVGLTALSIVGLLLSTRNNGIGGIFAGLFGSVTAWIGITAAVLIVLGIRNWMDNKISTLWEEELWHSDKHGQIDKSKFDDGGDIKESTHWLNALLSSIWPLVNPDLFVSLADTLEDVMQASLPSVVRMVSIEDIGQGSESFRILGVRWLPTGASSQSVGSNGKLQNPSNEPNDRSCPGEGELDQSTEQNDNQSNENGDQKSQGSAQEKTQISEGMEAEEGDYVNLEVAFSYRTRASSKKFRDKAKHAHLYVAFYLPGHIKLPVFVDLRGIVGIARLRLQLTPDPPFFSLMTFTFLGQPKVDLACVPLSRKGLNVMDLPLISNFVQSAVDAAVAEYVAPKSLTLDLKDMLAGEDFKKDPTARGVVVVTIKRAFDFKQGDAAIPLVREGSADPYVTVGWAKFAKPLWSTRVILAEMEPHWEETAFILVTPDELNVDERLRIQLWDSDRFTADDDLGRIEMDLKKVMKDPATRGKMSDRVDGFKALKVGEGMPGKLEWSVGYFPKTHIQDLQFKQQTAEPTIRTMEKLEQVVNETCQRKLREAKKDESGEFEQLRLQQYKEYEDRMVISAPPMDEYPSGILAVQIHEVTGLEIRAIHNADRYNKIDESSDEGEQGDELPSAYCNIMINHQKIYNTRVKPKNRKPFFNAGTERFIRDWRNTDLCIVVRDSRVHEDSPLIGLVHFNLGDLFKTRSQVNSTYPLCGGIGYGRVRVSLVFRSVSLKLPPNLLGWDNGTLVIEPEIVGKNLASDLHGLRLKLQTSTTTGHMYGKHTDDSEGHHWHTSHQKKLHLSVWRRYSSPLVIQFRKDRHFLDKTAGFAVLWLVDLVDDEDTTVTLDVWKGDLKRATTCYIRQCGEKVGEIQLKLKYCKGIGNAHKRPASKDENLREIVEVVETVRSQFLRDADEERDAVIGPADKKTQDHDDHDDSFDSSSDDDDDDEDGSQMVPHKKHEEDKGLERDGERGLRNSWSEYRSHAKQMHRKQRGIMQYKGARTMWWMKHKVDDLQDKVHGVFEHRGRTSGIESEA